MKKQRVEFLSRDVVRSIGSVNVDPEEFERITGVPFVELPERGSGGALLRQYVDASSAQVEFRKSEWGDDGEWLDIEVMD